LTRLLIMGPPGAGKGTQAARIAASWGIPAIATGDIFRENRRNRTPLGLQVEAIMDAGDYVPNSLTNAVVASRLDEDDARSGFLLDGYPRTVDQIEYLDELLASKGQSLDAVIQLVADQDEVVQRLLKRAHEQGRTDDTEETIRHRLELYDRETAPLIPVFRDRGLLVEVDGLGEIDDVAGRIASALSQRGVAAPAASAE
jgi:adenylate kinase